MIKYLAEWNDFESMIVIHKLTFKETKKCLILEGRSFLKIDMMHRFSKDGETFPGKRHQQVLRYLSDTPEEAHRKLIEWQKKDIEYKIDSLCHAHKKLKLMKKAEAFEVPER